MPQDIVPFNPEGDALERAMARGHERRKGHALEGHWIQESGFRELTRTCCIEEELNNVRDTASPS